MNRLHPERPFDDPVVALERKADELDGTDNPAVQRMVRNLRAEVQMYRDADRLRRRRRVANRIIAETFAEFLAQGIEAPSGVETRSGSTEGESPVPQSGMRPDPVAQTNKGER